MKLKEYTRKKSPKKSPRFLLAAIPLLAAAVVVLALVLLSDGSAGKHTGDPNTPSGQPTEFVRIAGQEVPVDENIDRNEYDAEAFSVDDRGRVVYDGDGVSYGIDVSAYQGEIDWQAVANDGIGFVILRAGLRGMTEGLLYTDDYFAANLRGAQEAGLDIGVYFFSQAITEQEAQEEAEYLLALLDGQKLAYPVYFDWEPGTDSEHRSYNIDYTTIGAMARTFCETIRNAGYESGIYFKSVQGYLHYDLSEFGDISLWLAEYDTRPEFYYHFHIWQYSCTGSVAGIEGDVDMDISFDNRD